MQSKPAKLGTLQNSRRERNWPLISERSAGGSVARFILRSSGTDSFDLQDQPLQRSPPQVRTTTSARAQGHRRINNPLCRLHHQDLRTDTATKRLVGRHADTAVARRKAAISHAANAATMTSSAPELPDAPGKRMARSKLLKHWPAKPAFDTSLSIGVSFDQACFDGKSLTADQPLLDAGRQEFSNSRRRDHSPGGDHACSWRTSSDPATHRPGRASKTISRPNQDRTDAAPIWSRSLADQKHPDHQLGINRGPASWDYCPASPLIIPNRSHPIELVTGRFCSQGFTASLLGAFAVRVTIPGAGRRCGFVVRCGLSAIGFDLFSIGERRLGGGHARLRQSRSHGEKRNDGNELCHPRL